MPLPQIVIFGTLTVLSLLLMARFLIAMDDNERAKRERTTTEKAIE